MKKTLTKIALFAALLLPVQAAFSQGSPHDGLYIGADATYDLTRFDSYRVESLTDMTPTDNKLIYDDEGLAAGLFIGYRLSERQFTLAVEGRYGYSFINNELSVAETYENTNEFGISVLPGIWVNDNMILFTRFGASQQTVTRTFEGVLNQNSDTGFHFGAGVEIILPNNLAIRGEYNRATFQHEMSQVFVDNTVDPAVTTQVDFQNKFRRDRFQVSMIARF
ncbi:porin family protein [Pseudemcibacter aquimaris]|uniref:porin family protein n=1 Tax=Pseudemcibacter aquimaris TaxID=2857064 RepID=UPI00201325AB|nr:porin family protein [Pseudemcibacter aquimaris]MCC3860262.1 porin family protein [Pseudemcibacter aquimaris]WDU57587.1 porin family protein [Pseudemcibacter aquimaris]